MKKQHVTLSEADRGHLQDLIKRNDVSAKTYKRALGLLELDKGRTYTEMAGLIGVTVQTASSWAGKYRKEYIVFAVEPYELSETKVSPIVKTGNQQ